MFVRFRQAATGVSLCAAALCLAAPSFAQPVEEMDILQMIYKDTDLVTPTRSPKPISQVAENVTVINADEIEAINAHTLADVLWHVTGVQMDIRGGPGSSTSAFIQGSDPRHVRVMVDGVTINNLADDFADIGSFPVQQIERIEIIKGPASSTWGSSLGGIINIITKSPDPDRKIGGVASSSIGERTTADLRTELSGTVGSLGYYIYGGGLTSDGLTTNTPDDKGDMYAKLLWDANRNARLQLTLAYDKGARGDGQVPLYNVSIKDSFEYFFSTLSFNYAFSDDLSLDISGRVSTKRNKQFQNSLISGEELAKTVSNELDAGGSAKLAWKKGIQSLLVGADYDSGSVDSADFGGRQTEVRWALFANDTISLWDFSLTPGLRYDHTSTSVDFVSPSLGLTYSLFEKTIFRAYVARGFNSPPLGFISFVNAGGFTSLKPEEVWSYSLGGETAVLKYFWLKVTGFINDIRNVITQNPNPPFQPLNAGKQCRQGVEAELRTIPLFHTSLLAGYSFIDATDRETHQVIKNVPRYTYDLGIDYNDKDTLRGALRGHYIWWNASPDANAKYTAMIWDLNLAKKFFERDSRAVEAFFTAHNIFNGAQYSEGVFPNPCRWFEGGLRFKF